MKNKNYQKKKKKRNITISSWPGVRQQFGVNGYAIRSIQMKIPDKLDYMKI